MGTPSATYLGIRGQRVSFGQRGPTVVGIVQGCMSGGLPAADPDWARDRPFEWGCDGPGALHLAESILLHRLGFLPEGPVAPAFLADVVSKLPEQFELSASEVDAWIGDRLIDGSRGRVHADKPQPSLT